MNQLVIIGGGPGNEKYILPAASEAMETADFVFADRRFIDQVTNPNKDIFGSLSQLPQRIREKLAQGSVAVVVSGDPLFYSLTRLLKANFPEESVTIIPGIGSLGYFAAKCQRTVEQAVYFSAHGRDLSVDTICSAAMDGKDVYLLCDKDHDPAWVARGLVEKGLGHMTVAAGSTLSYPDERIVTAPAAKVAKMTFDPLSVAAVFGRESGDKEGTQPVLPGQRTGQKPERSLLCDDAFIRDQTPMTREEVRWIILGKLGLMPGDTVWDIGAGTGSVSVECARFLQGSGGQVYSVERSLRAVALLKKNREKFGLDNMHILEGDAMEQIPSLPVPQKVFIGGSGRELKDILAFICRLGRNIKVVTACVTMETQSEALSAYARLGFCDVDMVQVQISRAKPLGSYHILESGHPILLCMGRTGEPNEQN